jgi:hypothetical protein
MPKIEEAATQLSMALGAIKTASAVAIEKEVIPSQPSAGQAQISGGAINTTAMGAGLAGRTSK